MQITKVKAPFCSLLCASAVFGASSGQHAWAQSVDALLHKLVEKGILTTQEADDLSKEAEKGSTPPAAVKTGMPDYVKSVQFSGDFRGRYDGLISGNTYESDGETLDFQDRHRFRYRLRFGAVVTLFDNLEVGLRLGSSEQVSRNNSSQGGDPISGNTSFTDNGSKKFIYVDAAYGKWTAFQGPVVTASLTAGKMFNPFEFSSMLFDEDYTPEGAAIQSRFVLSKKHALNATAGGFVLDEIDVSSQDPAMVGAQLRWEADWSPRVTSTLGAAVLGIVNAEKLSNSAVPNVGRGNTRGADGALVHDYYPYVLEGALTYKLDKFPMYKGEFPIKIEGEYMRNQGAPSDADNHGWNAGIIFGKSGKKGGWDLSYSYKWLGANSWWEEVVDSDFGAFYGQANSPINSGRGIGYSSGTNVKGHIVRFAFSPADALTLSARWLYTSLIEPFPAESDSDIHRLLVDATFKF